MGIFRQILAEAGHVEGRNLTAEYRWAEGQYDRLPDLATDLVKHQVTLIVAPNTPAALAAKAASKAIPVVFSAADDPVSLGLVASLARPGGNVTGVHYFNTNLGAKQLGLLREFYSSDIRVGLLINPNNSNARTVMEEVKAAASTVNMEIEVVWANEPSEIETAFVGLARSRADALMLGADPFFFGRREQLVTLAARHRLPAIYNAREYAEAGGLMSYGTSLKEVYQQLAIYTVRILKGEYAGAYRRPYPSRCGCNRHSWLHAGRGRSQRGNHHDPDRVRRRRRPGQTRPSRQSCAARRQRNWHQFFVQRGCSQAIGAAA
jgi:ABC-type uncharacterized transport system substrate-binding protein